jgi:hypothetical protein
MTQEGFRRNRRCGIDERPGHPVTIEIGENMEKVRTLVRTEVFYIQILTKL